MPKTTPSPPVRPRPQQERSRRTEEALLDAAVALLRERGVEAVTVGDIAAAVGMAPATIYRRFGDKEGLIREAFRRFTDSALQMLALAPSAPPPRSFVALVADITLLVMRFAQVNQRLLQSGYARALVDDDYAQPLTELRTRTLATLRQRFLQHADEICHPDPPLAIEFALRQAVAMLSARLEAGKLDVGRGSMKDAVFVRELMRSIFSYLRVPFTVAAIDKALTARGL
jgi:AcrR family transcriptional regulator